MIERLEGHVRRGEFLLAVQEAERLLMLPDLCGPERARVFRLVGRVRYELGDLYGATKMFELAIQSAFQVRDWDCLGAARAEIGAAFVRLGDLPMAIEHLQVYLLDRDRYKSARAYLGMVHFNLGLAYSRRREVRLAIAHYGTALDWFIEKGYPVDAGEIHQNLAWLHLSVGDLAGADVELQVSETFTDRCPPRYRVEQLVCRAYLLRMQGRLGESMELVKEVLNPQRTEASAAHRGNAAWIAGQIAHDLGQLETATKFGEMAMSHALEAKDPSIMNRVNELLTDVRIARTARGRAVD